MDIDEEKVFIPEVIEAGAQGEDREGAQTDKAKIGCALAGVSYFVMTVLGVIIYIWSIVIAYDSMGFLGAILTLIFPVFSQVFWGFVLWAEKGTIVTPYCLALLGYLFCVLLIRIGLLIFQANLQRQR
ncbi:MAG: hypothetical protein WCX16_01670 [Candidatus Omnitrophota bacterium]